MSGSRTKLIPWKIEEDHDINLFNPFAHLTDFLDEYNINLFCKTISNLQENKSRSKNWTWDDLSHILSPQLKKWLCEVNLLYYHILHEKLVIPLTSQRRLELLMKKSFLKDITVANLGALDLLIDLLPPLVEDFKLQQMLVDFKKAAQLALGIASGVDSEVITSKIRLLDNINKSIKEEENYKQNFLKAEKDSATEQFFQKLQTNLTDENAIFAALKLRESIKLRSETGAFKFEDFTDKDQQQLFSQLMNISSDQCQYGLYHPKRLAKTLIDLGFTIKELKGITITEVLIWDAAIFSAADFVINGVGNETSLLRIAFNEAQSNTLPEEYALLTLNQNCFNDFEASLKSSPKTKSMLLKNRVTITNNSQPGFAEKLLDEKKSTKLNYRKNKFFKKAIINVKNTVKDMYEARARYLSLINFNADGFFNKYLPAIATGTMSGLILGIASGILIGLLAGLLVGGLGAIPGAIIGASMGGAIGAGVLTGFLSTAIPSVVEHFCMPEAPEAPSTIIIKRRLHIPLSAESQQTETLGSREQTETPGSREQTDSPNLDSSTNSRVLNRSWNESSAATEIEESGSFGYGPS